MLGSGYFIFQECWPKQCFMQNSVVRDITFFSEKNNLHFGPGTIHKKLQWNFLRFQWHLWALLKFRSGRGDGRFDGWADGGLPAREGEVSTAIAPFLPRQLMSVDGSGNPAVDTILTSTSGEISKWLAGCSSPQLPPTCTIQLYLRIGFSMYWFTMAAKMPVGEWLAICHIQF